jgi:hypothetical protein
MREAYRLQKPSLQHELEKTGKYLAIFIIYTGNEFPKYNNISEKMTTALQYLKKIVE